MLLKITSCLGILSFLKKNSDVSFLITPSGRLARLEL